MNQDTEKMTNEQTEQPNENPVSPENQETGNESLQTEEEKLKAQVEELNDKYIRLFAEFDNFKRRTAKERLDLIKTAGADVLGSMITVLDDFDRAQKSITDAKDLGAVKEGLNLVHHKLKTTLQNQGLKEMESSIGKEFNTDLHEAITNAPAPSEELRGKIIDEIEKGYYLNDKVIRFAKVVVGA